ncbi:MAG: phage tail sheath C-terminal domain-containing protein [Candidatus Pacearchaeota archaeon]
MTLSGGSAAVNIQEIDLSTRVPGFPGVYGCLLLPCSKGPIDQPRLTTSETQFLQTFTPLGKVEVGDSLGFFSGLAFMQKSDKMWVQRVIGDNYKYGGLAIRKLNQTTNIAWVAGETDPTAYTFDTNDRFTIYQADPGDWSDDICLKIWLKRDRESLTLNSTNIVNAVATSATAVIDAKITVNAVAGSTKNGIVINIVDGGTAGAETAVKVGNVITVTIEDTVSTQNQIRTALLTLVADILTVTVASGATAWDLSAGTNTATLSGGTDASTKILSAQEFVSGEPIRFTMLSSATGDVLPTGLDLTSTYYTVRDTATSFKLANSLDNALAGVTLVLSSVGQGTAQIIPMKVVSEVNSFLIEVFHRSNLNIPVESWPVSLEIGSKDGFGQNLYIEDVLEGSNLIRAMVNPLTLGNPLPQVTPLYHNGGNDGDPVTDGKMMLAADKFENADTYPVTCFMDGGWATPAYQKHIDAIAQKRHDCVCLLSVPYEREASENYLNEITDYWMNVLNLSSSFSALYTPHVKIYDKFNDRNLFVSPEGYAGAAISYSALNFEMWFPPAGFRRGQVNVLDLRRRFSKGEMDYLYDGAVSGGGGINPLRFAPGRGILIWGNKTLLGRPSTLSRLHVRLLLCVIEPAIAKTLEDFLFELNDEATRSQVEDLLIDYMNDIKARRGVYDFLVVCNDSNNSATDIDQYRMNVDLYIKPTQDVEYVNFRVVITRTGASFTDAQEAVVGSV